MASKINLSDPTELNAWGERMAVQGVPNGVLRSALFGAIRCSPQLDGLRIHTAPLPRPSQGAEPEGKPPQAREDPIYFCVAFCLFLQNVIKEPSALVVGVFCLPTQSRHSVSR